LSPKLSPELIGIVWRDNVMPNLNQPQVGIGSN